MFVSGVPPDGRAARERDRYVRREIAHHTPEKDISPYAILSLCAWLVREIHADFIACVQQDRHNGFVTAAGAVTTNVLAGHTGVVRGTPPTHACGRHRKNPT